MHLEISLIQFTGHSNSIQEYLSFRLLIYWRIKYIFKYDVEVFSTFDSDEIACISQLNKSYATNN